ncbi:hypothetical protein HDU85_006667 [Gaertneriomyces sp. JEL0708]|nr:hypothetical protein HDU85_006667 [Gaertneriomyces sp. JEL0708]
MEAGKEKGLEDGSVQLSIPLSSTGDKPCRVFVGSEPCGKKPSYSVGNSWFCDAHDPYKKERSEALESEGAFISIQLSRKLSDPEKESLKKKMEEENIDIICRSFENQNSKKRCHRPSCYLVGDIWFCGYHDPFKTKRPKFAPSVAHGPPEKDKKDRASASKTASLVGVGSSRNSSSTTTTSVSVTSNWSPVPERPPPATQELKVHGSQLQGNFPLVPPAASTSAATISTPEGPRASRDGPPAPLATPGHVETASEEASDDDTASSTSNSLTPDVRQPHRPGVDPQQLASRTSYCPHVAITVNTTNTTEKEHAVEPATNASAKRTVLDLITSTFSPAAADPTDENAPTSDGYYIIAICALTGLLIGFIIMCVQKDVEPLAIAPVISTIIGAEGLLLKMYYQKRDRERFRRKEAFRQDLAKLCQREDVQQFLRISSHHTKREICDECKDLGNIFNEHGRVAILKGCECREKQQSETVSQKHCGKCAEILCRTAKEIDAVFQWRKNCTCSEDTFCGNCVEILRNFFDEDDAVFKSKRCSCGREKRFPLPSGDVISMKDLRRDYLFSEIKHLYGDAENFRIKCRNAVTAFHLLWIRHNKNRKSLLEDVLFEASDEIAMLTALADYEFSIFNEKHTRHAWWPEKTHQVEETRLYHLCLLKNQFHSFWDFKNFVKSTYKGSVIQATTPDQRAAQQCQTPDDDDIESQRSNST